MSVLWRYISILLTVLLLSAGCTAVRTTMPVDEPGSEEPPVEKTEPAEKVVPVEILEEFWPDGSIRIRREVVRGADGEPVDHGVYARWHMNGHREYEVVFDHGRKDGVATRWHMSGRVWIEEVYVLGSKEGACRTWNEAGDLVKEEQYAGGKPHGTWTVWKKGVVRARSCFDHGVPVDCPPETAPE